MPDMMTLGSLRTSLRRRLSEPADDDVSIEPIEIGLWSDADLDSYINEAQIVVARDSHSTVHHPWSSSHKNTTPIVSGAEFYYMDPDFLVMESVAHFREGFRPRKLVKANIKNLRLNNYYYARDTRYAYYEVRGREAPFIAYGVATATHKDGSQLEDTNGEFDSVRIGDVVHNLTDNSTADVTGFSSGFIRLDNWIGGTSQAFFEGDEYRVQQLERSRWLCWVYPPQTVTDPIAYSGTSTAVVVLQDRFINALELKFDKLPNDWQDDSRVSVHIIQRADGEIFDRFGAVNIRTGTNKINIRNFRLDQNVNYEVKAYINADDMPELMDLDQEVTEGRLEARDSTGNYRLKISQVEMRYDNGDFLEFSYVQRPLFLRRDDAFSEFPEEAHSVLIAYAKVLAYEKKDPDGRMHVQMQNIYENQLNKWKEFLELQDESGNDVVGGQMQYFYDDTPSFTEFYGDVY